MNSFLRKSSFYYFVFLFLIIFIANVSAEESGLVAYYPFNGNADDESGNGNNGTVYGATLTTDRYDTPNSCFSFDGYNDYILVPDSNYLDLQTSFTIAAWVYLKGSSKNCLKAGTHHREQLI